MSSWYKREQSTLTLKVAVPDYPSLARCGVLDPVDADVYDGAAGLKHVARDEAGDAGGHDEDVRVFDVVEELLGGRVSVADGGGSVPWWWK